MILFRVSNVTSGRDKVHYITSDVSQEFRLAVNIDKSNHTMSYHAKLTPAISWADDWEKAMSSGSSDISGAVKTNGSIMSICHLNVVDGLYGMVWYGK